MYNGNNLQKQEKQDWRTRWKDVEFTTGQDGTVVQAANTNLYREIKHDVGFESDIKEIARLGLRKFRLSFIGQVLQPEFGTWNFSSYDRMVGILKDNGMLIEADCMHHNNFTVIRGGFSNHQFAQYYVEYALRVIERYREQIDTVTLLNEVFTNAIFAGQEGKWFPYYKTEQDFVRMLVNQAKAVCLLSRALKSDIIKTRQNETCEHHQALDVQSLPYVAFRNALRFLSLDLIFGMVNTEHSLYHYFTHYGISEAELAWFEEHPAIVDSLGNNYYYFHEQQWREPRYPGDPGWIRPSKQPLGYAKLAMQYWDRYKNHVSEICLHEHNLRGYVFDRISSLRYMGMEIDTLLQAGISFTEWQLYPAFDTKCWATECSRYDNQIDPHGMIYWLDDKLNRHASILSHYVEKLVRKQIHASDLPAFRFQDPVDEELAGFIKERMNNWNFVDSQQFEIYAKQFNRTWTPQKAITAVV